MKTSLIPLALGLWVFLPAADAAADPSRRGAGPAARGEIVVEIIDLQPGGRVLVALFDDKRRFPSFEGQVAAKRVVVSGTRARAVFESVPYGRYAVAVVHDRNDNGRLDTRLGIIPAEPVGFSNAAKIGRFGPPSFETAAFDLRAKRRPVTVTVE